MLLELQPEVSDVSSNLLSIHMDLNHNASRSRVRLL